jgi:hypothetical protein
MYIIGTVRRNTKLYTSSSRTNLQLDKKCIADLVPSSHVFSMRRNHKKKNPVIHLSSHTTAQEEEVCRTHGGNPHIKPKNHHILQVYWQQGLSNTLIWMKGKECVIGKR